MRFKFPTFILIQYLLMVSPVRAAFDLKSAGAPSAALGGAADAVSLGAEAAFKNPAGLGMGNGVELFSFYSRLYSLKELSYAGSAASVPLPAGSMGFAYAQFGEEIYQEKEAGVSYAIGLTPKVFLGASAKGYLLKIDEFGQARALGVDVGVLSRVHPNARLSIAAKNVNRPGIGRSQIPLPTGISAGGVLQLIDGLRLYAEVEAVEPHPVLFKSGLEFSLSDRFFVRGGARSQSVQFSGGFGVHLRGVRLDYAYAHSLLLPGTHQISIGIQWGGNRG